MATVLDPAANLRPASLLDPLRLGLLRAVSTAWRDAPTRAAQLTAGQSSQLDELRRSVRIVQPPGPYSLDLPTRSRAISGLTSIGASVPAEMSV